MSGNRLFFLIVVLGGITLLTLFIMQNWSVIPPLSLVFLGLQTQPLPLSIWILISTVAGAIAYEVVGILLKLQNFHESQETFTSSNYRKTKTSTHNYSQRYSSGQTESRYERGSAPPPKNTTRSQTPEYDDYDDWENAGEVDDWNFEDEREEASNYYRDTEVRDANPPPNYRATNDRATNNRATKSSDDDSDSSYSYNSRESKNSGVGKTESIYDADYRVITSPYKSSSTNEFDEKEHEDDEWDFLEDDDFEVEDKRPRK